MGSVRVPRACSAFSAGSTTASRSTSTFAATRTSATRLSSISIMPPNAASSSTTKATSRLPWPWPTGNAGSTSPCQFPARRQPLHDPDALRLVSRTLGHREVYKTGTAAIEASFLRQAETVRGTVMRIMTGLSRCIRGAGPAAAADGNRDSQGTSGSSEPPPDAETGPKQPPDVRQTPGDQGFPNLNAGIRTRMPLVRAPSMCVHVSRTGYGAASEDRARPQA